MANDKNDALKDYVEVNVRIEKFHQKYPNGRIQTEILSNENGLVLMKSSVYRDATDSVPSATGHAQEKEGSSYINKTSYIENCETSAVGRALAILGFEIKKSVASKEEVANAKHQQEQPARPAPIVNTVPMEVSSTYPSDAQIKMISAKLATCGYLKKDMEIVLTVISGFLGYDVKQLLDIKKADVTRLAEFLAVHKKETNK